MSLKYSWVGSFPKIVNLLKIKVIHQINTWNYNIFDFIPNITKKKSLFSYFYSLFI